MGFRTGVRLPSAPSNHVNPNSVLDTLFFVKHCFGFVFIMEEVQFGLLLYILENDMNIYGSVGLKFPRPEFVLVYTGKDIDAEKKILSLSELYDSSGDIPLELKIRVISGKDKKDTILREYIEFCWKYDEYRKGCKSRAEILAALKDCYRNPTGFRRWVKVAKNRHL